MGQEEGLLGMVVRHLWGLPEEAVVIEDLEEAAVRPFLGEEEGQRQKPCRR